MLKAIKDTAILWAVIGGIIGAIYLSILFPAVGAAVGFVLCVLIQWQCQ